MNGVDWLAARIIAATTVEQRARLRELPRFNPRPAGVIRPDGATVEVLALLREHQGRQFCRFQILRRLPGRSQQAVNWALLYLREQGLITAYEDSGRNTRYLRYAAVDVGKE